MGDDIGLHSVFRSHYALYQWPGCMRTVAHFQVWDLDATGSTPGVAGLRDLGFDALSIGLVQPAMQVIKRAANSDPRVSEYPSGFCYQPHANAYAGARIKPTGAKWLKQRDPFERMAELAVESRLDLIARIDFSDLSGLVERNPLAGTVSIAGDTNSNRLCPCNRDALEFFGALAEDVSSHYPVKRVELSGIGFANGLMARGTAPAPVCGEIESYLLSLCFCPSCRENAKRQGVNVERVLRVATESLDAEGEPAGMSIAGFIQSHPDIVAFEQARQQAALNQIAIMRERSEVPIAWRTAAMPDSPAAFRELVEAIVIDDSLALSGDAAGSDSQRRSISSGVEIAIDPSPRQFASAQSLVRRVKTLSDQGYTTFHFERMGELPPHCLDWIRQAIRYAKRENAT